MELLKEIDLFITELLNNIGILAPLIAGVLIVIESIIPVLPLSLFITLNFYYFGTTLGFLISWILTCVGCYLSFFIFRSNLKFKFDNKFIKEKDNRITKWMNLFNRLKLEQIVLILAIPFTPAFVFNIVAGLSEMDKKKFIISIVISKIFLVFFWGFVGTSFLESFKNPMKILEVIGMCLLAFIISKVVNKRYGIE